MRYYYSLLAIYAILYYTIAMKVMFCGHRTLNEKDKIREALLIQIDKLLLNAESKGESITFYCGGYGDFDMLAAKTVDLLRKKYSDIKCENIFITPYITQGYKQRNEFMSKQFDEIIYPPIENAPYRLAIIKRNEWMVKNCDIVICHVIYSWGGAARTLEFAIKNKKQIIRI